MVLQSGNQVSLRLSGRQREILALIIQGQSDKEIATRLGLSISTVKTYLGRVYRQHGFRNRAEAAAACAIADLAISLMTAIPPGSTA